MNLVEFLERELEETEDGIELASDPERPANVLLLPKLIVEKALLERLLRKAKNYDT